ncbi:MAG: hypothetical protein KC996_07490 [Phycisphaerales bacterium]|nr:hypothetical protein [Phycisphaerales bacterium]
MKRQDHDRFWMLYEQQTRQPIERACRSASRRRTDSSMDIDDMVAWVDTRVWRMLERDAYPTFHDDPTPEQAIERLVNHSATLARWAYLALCRKHFRREQQKSEYLGGMSRAERLSMVSAVDTKIEKREELDAALGALRNALSNKDKQKMAASYVEKGERHRVALVLGATRREDDREITKTLAGVVKENTVQQMRSRARKRAQEVLNAAVKLPLVGMIAVLGVVLATSATPAEAGEQTGGRKGSRVVDIQGLLAHQNPAVPGEQTGGRRPGE